MKLRVLRRLVGLNVMMTLEYRGSFFLYMLSNVAVPVISLLVWLTVSEQGARLPLSREELVTYYLLLSVVSMLTSTWLSAWLAQSIRQGEISPWLLRPVPYILDQIGNNLGEKITKLVLLIPMVGFVAVFFRADIRLPSEPFAWLLFVLCLPMTATVAFLMDFLLGSLAFWLEDVNGLVRVKTLVSGFLSGQIVPLALFPREFEGFLKLQPFRYALSFPLEVLTTSLSPRELALGFGLQAAYCGVFFVAYRVVWRSGLRAYSAVGA